jgi:hypothetical protein
MALAGVFAATASAETGTAKWSSGYPVKVSGSLTFEKSTGGPTVTCQAESTLTETQRPISFKCPSVSPYGVPLFLTFGPNMPGPRWISEGSEVHYTLPIFRAFTFTNNPWNGNETFGPRVNTMDVANGNAVEASHTAFNHTYVGWLFGESADVYATGTVNYTTSGGGLTTIVK